jgi:hypothetical protein
MNATTLLQARPSAGLVGALLIAAGSPWETVVRDARGIYPWASASVVANRKEGRMIVYHHTATSDYGRKRSREELQRLAEIAQGSDFGLPYNFVVSGIAPFRVWYLNDVDQCWPHTYGHNCATAVAAFGNYSEGPPHLGMVVKMLRLGDALAHMWGEWVPETLHGKVGATECPGTKLAPVLQSRIDGTVPRDQLHW